MMQDYGREVSYHVMGVPLRAGSLYPGSEDDARAYRDAHIVQRLEEVGCRVFDEGDVEIPSYLPHHDIPPIKNWPGPRIAWELVGESIASHLKQPGRIPLLVGADCSVVAGTSRALMRAYGEDVHILYLDGDADDAPPDPERCNSAAYMSLWLTTRESPFRGGSALDPSQVTVVGHSEDMSSPPLGLRSLPLDEVRRVGAGEAARQALQDIPDSAPILVHFDVDVLDPKEMPAAYFPHEDGMSMAECRELLRATLADPRIRAIEVTEYASLRDFDGIHVSSVVDLLAESLGRAASHPNSTKP